MPCVLLNDEIVSISSPCLSYSETLKIFTFPLGCMKCFLKTSCDLREIHIRKLLKGHHFSCLRSNIISFQFKPLTNTVPQTLYRNWGFKWFSLILMEHAHEISLLIIYAQMQLIDALWKYLVDLIVYIWFESSSTYILGVCASSECSG